jgi:Ca2+-transporting ATPase
MATPTTPVGRPRAPTITIDTTSNGAEHVPEVTSAVSGDPNSLSVPGLRARGDSVNSQSTTGSTIVDSHQASDKSTTPTHIPDEEVFNPEDEADAKLFNAEDSPFGVTLGHLAKFLPRKNVQALALLHGPAGLEKGLRTDLSRGLDVREEKLNGTVSLKEVQSVPVDAVELDSIDPKGVKRSDTTATGPPSNDDLAFSDRKRIFGDNRLPSKKTKSLLQLAWIALQDKILILLTVAAIVSLAVGIYSSVTKKAGEGARIDWVEGVAILVAVAIVVSVGAVVDFRKEKQFAKLNKQKEDRMIKVLRSGKTRLISVYDVYPGDIVHLEPGDMIPVDGIYIQGSGVACDESAATGESDVIKKTPAVDVVKAYNDGRWTPKMDPFLIAGSQVQEGIGTFLCTAVGVNSSHGKTLMSLQEDTPPTPLQERLDKLAGRSNVYFLGSSNILNRWHRQIWSRICCSIIFCAHHKVRNIFQQTSRSIRYTQKCCATYSGIFFGFHSLRHYRSSGRT